MGVTLSGQWNRVLSAEEIEHLHEDPWAMFAETPRSESLITMQVSDICTIDPAGGVN